MVVDAEKVEELLSQVKELPSLPTVVTKLLELLNNENVQVKHVADLIAADPAFSVKVLQLVNSPFYGLSKEISSVSQAVVILGFSTIRSLILGASVIEAFRGPGIHEGYFSPETFWPHCIGTAAGAFALAKLTETDRPENAFSAGLLHGVGLLVLDQHLPSVMKDIQERVEVDGLSLLEAEEEEIGVNHAWVGAKLLEFWSLPAEMVAAVRFHADVDQASSDSRRLAALVHLADIFSRTLGYGNAGEPGVPNMNEHALEILGLTPSSFSILLEPIDEEIQKASSFLELIK